MGGRLGIPQKVTEWRPGRELPGGLLVSPGGRKGMALEPDSDLIDCPAGTAVEVFVQFVLVAAFGIPAVQYHGHDRRQQHDHHREIEDQVPDRDGGRPVDVAVGKPGDMGEQNACHQGVGRADNPVHEHGGQSPQNCNSHDILEENPDQRCAGARPVEHVVGDQIAGAVALCAQEPADCNRFQRKPDHGVRVAEEFNGPGRSRKAGQ